MKNYVVDNYENYQEENRLTTNHARRIEYLTTVRVMDELIGTGMKILDCAAGTGIYSFYLAERGNQLTATDITPRHIDIINDILQGKNYQMNTAVLDATDLGMFEDDSFDVVLNMGPFYHLLTEEQRSKCMSESLRVLKKGGLIFTAYIPRFYLYQMAALSDSQYLDKDFAEQITQTGILRHDDEKCFWTDTYYSSKSEMEELYIKNNVQMTDHFAQDGLTPLFAQKVDCWTEEEFKVWCDYHYSVCREQSILGMSNHTMIVGRKL